MVVTQSITDSDSLSRQLFSVHGIQQTLLCEQHYELIVLSHLLTLTKTDFGISLGLPASFWDGSYTKEGEEKMIRLQDVIHKGAWKKHLKRPEGYQLPPGFTLVNVSLTKVTIDFTRFFIKHYSKRYKALPRESRKFLFNGARACSIYESFEEKSRLEMLGLQGFASPEVYELYKEGMTLRDTYPFGIRNINAEAKRYRTTQGRYGISPEERLARLAAWYKHEDERMKQIVLRARTLSLPSPPKEMLPFNLLETPPAEAFI